MKSAPPVVALLLLMWSAEAMAARNASVAGKNVQLRSAPSASSEALSQLTEGEPVEISNYPTQGYYKIRTSTGQVGWVDAGSLSLGAAELPPAPSALGVPSAPPKRPAQKEVEYEDAPTGESDRSSDRLSKARASYEVKVFGGIQKIQLSEVEQIVGAALFKSTPYFGGQLGYPVDDRLRLLLRIEFLKTSADIASNLAPAHFDLSSIPVMTGLSYAFVREKGFMLQGSVLMGIAFATNLDLTISTLPAPNQTELSSTAFTEMFKVDGSVPLGKVVSFYAETGYRILKTPSVGPSKASNSNTLLQSNGVVQPVPMDLSGLFIGGGFSFYF